MHTFTITPGFTSVLSICISLCDDFELAFDNAGDGTREDFGVALALVPRLEVDRAGVSQRCAAAAAVALYIFCGRV